MSATQNAAPGLRFQILVALRRQIAANGLQALTVRDFAASCGVATRTLYNLFGSKDNLISESIRESYQTVMDSIAAKPDPDASPLTQLLEYVELSSRWMRSESGYSRAMIYTDRASGAGLRKAGLGEARANVHAASVTGRGGAARVNDLIQQGLRPCDFDARPMRALFGRRFGSAS
jgi:AcrR family transcriptional regulator